MSRKDQQVPPTWRQPVTRRSFLQGAAALGGVVLGGSLAGVSAASSTKQQPEMARTIAVIEKGMAEKLHPGAQLYVSLHGKPLWEYVAGIAREGVPMSGDSMFPWHSTTKCIMAAAAGKAWERGLFDLDDKACKYVPEFGAKGKEAIAIRHLLTHSHGMRAQQQGGFGRGAGGEAGKTWEGAIAHICDAEAGWAPGTKATYDGRGLWIAAEIIRRLDGRTYDRYVREEIFEPLGMNNCWIGMPAERYGTYGDLIGDMYDTKGDVPKPTGERAQALVTRCMPTGTGRGPMRELARYFEMFLHRGQREGVRILTPQTVEAITVCQTYKLSEDRWWGLTMAVDNVLYGRHCSPRTFGHGGAGSSAVYCDPEYGLVVAMMFNGMPERVSHIRRMEAVSTAIYEDLGLAEPGSPGRDHPITGG